ncbi:MAG: phage portal protein [Pseudonocardiales bacterium]
MTAPAVYRPEEARDELVEELALLRPQFDECELYYNGEPPLAQDPARLTEAYRELLEMSRSNWCRLVVDVVAERLVVESIRSTASPESDTTAWGWWQANNLDSYSANVHREALKAGIAYVGVWTGARPDAAPRITGQVPTQVHVRYDEDDVRAVDAVRVWVGRDLHLYCTVYTDSTVYKYISADPLKRDKTKTYTAVALVTDITRVEWKPRADAEGGPVISNPLGRVPFARFRCNPGLTGNWVSEIYPIRTLQRRINKTTFHRMLTQEFTAFPQRWATGMDIPLDDNGDPVETLDAAIDRVWTATSSETQFGQFPAGSAEPYLRAEQSDVQALATQSRTPPHYLTGGMGVFPSGESVRATEYGLFRKVGGHQGIFGEGWSDTIRLSALAAKNDQLAEDDGIDVVWANVEARSEGEIVDSLLKMSTLGVPRRVLWERWGATPQEVARWTEEVAREAEAIANLPEVGPGAGNGLPDGGEPEILGPSQVRASAF